MTPRQLRVKAAFSLRFSGAAHPRNFETFATKVAQGTSLAFSQKKSGASDRPCVLPLLAGNGSA